jgi:DNA transposition AAA+ family ATPase
MFDPKVIEKLAKEAEERRQKELVDKLVETQTKVVTASYDRATAYTNVIIVAGYAAFFGLWTLTKTYISKPLALWAALLMAFSAATFMIFEVYKMFWTGRALSEQFLTLSDRIKDKPPQAALAEFQKLETDMKRMTLRFLPVWRIVLLLVVSTGFGAIGLLGFAFIRALLAVDG